MYRIAYATIVLDNSPCIDDAAVTNGRVCINNRSSHDDSSITNRRTWTNTRHGVNQTNEAPARRPEQFLLFPARVTVSDRDNNAIILGQILQQLVAVTDDWPFSIFCDLWPAIVEKVDGIPT
jgi:hypothetical protein